MNDEDTLDNRVTALEQNGIPGVRDFFATSALSFLASEWWSRNVSPEGIAKRAYAIADAMMKERNKEREE